MRLIGSNSSSMRVFAGSRPSRLLSGVKRLQFVLPLVASPILRLPDNDVRIGDPPLLCEAKTRRDEPFLLAERCWLGCHRSMPLPPLLLGLHPARPLATMPVLEFPDSERRPVLVVLSDELGLAFTQEPEEQRSFPDAPDRALRDQASYFSFPTAPAGFLG